MTPYGSLWVHKLERRLRSMGIIGVVKFLSTCPNTAKQATVDIEALGVRPRGLSLY